MDAKDRRIAELERVLLSERARFKKRIALQNKEISEFKALYLKRSEIGFFLYPDNH